jgi:hypothetical protein
MGASSDPIGEYASFRQDQFNVPEAQTEDVIEPDSMANDFGRKAMTIMRVGGCFHSSVLASIWPPHQLSLK